MRVQATINLRGESVIAVEADVTQDGDLERLVQNAQNKFHLAFPNEPAWGDDYQIIISKAP